MRFLSRLDTKQASGGGDSPVAWDIPQAQRGRPYRTQWDLKRAIEEGMRRVTWSFRVVDAIASNVSKLPARARKDDPIFGRFIADHPVARLLNGKSNPAEPSKIFRYRLAATALLSRKGAFVEVIRNKMGQPIGLYLLPTQYTNIIPDPTTFIAGYEVRLPGGEPVVLPPDRVCWVRLKPHPDDPYLQLTFIEAAGLAIDSDWLLHNYNRNFIRNDGRPGGILAVKGSFEDEDAEELRQRFTGPPGSQGRISVIDAEQFSFVDTAVSHRDAQFLEALKAGKEEILMAGGVPESVIGNASGRTFDNAEAELGIFWRETGLPHLSMTGACLDMIDGDETTFLVFDPEEIAVLKRDRVVAQQHLLEEVAAGTVSREGYRAETGREPSGVPEMAMYYIPSTLVPIGTPPPSPAAAGGTVGKAICTCDLVTNALARDDGERGKVLAPARGFGAHRPWCPVAVEEQLTLSRMVLGQKMLARPLDPHDPGVRAELKAMRLSELKDEERLVTRELRRHFKREARVLAAKMRDREQVPKAADLFDVGKWKKQLGEDMTPVLEEVYQRWGDRVFDQFSKAARQTETKADMPVFDVHDDRVTQRILDQVNRLVGVEDTTYDQIKEAIADVEAEGGSIPDIASAIQDVFDEADNVRAETIARTEVLSAANGASVEAADQDGSVSQKEWLATDDDRTRLDHADADGQQVGLDEPFDVGGEALEYPGDPAGEPGNVINCRCTVVFV